jgi:hypothetical protein
MWVFILLVVWLYVWLYVLYVWLCVWHCVLIFTSGMQVMRMSTPNLSPVVKERKVSQSASSKIDCIIKQLFLPMLTMPTPERTSFLPEDAEDQLLRQVAQEKPGALSTESDFVDYMVLLYRKFHKDSHKESKDRNDSDAGNLVDPGLGEPSL